MTTTLDSVWPGRLRFPSTLLLLRELFPSLYPFLISAGIQDVSFCLQASVLPEVFFVLFQVSIISQAPFLYL